MLEYLIRCRSCGFSYWGRSRLEAEVVDLDDIYEEVRGAEEDRIYAISV